MIIQVKCKNPHRFLELSSQFAGSKACPNSAKNGGCNENTVGSVGNVINNDGNNDRKGKGRSEVRGRQGVKGEERYRELGGIWQGGLNVSDDLSTQHNNHTNHTNTATTTTKTSLTRQPNPPNPKTLPRNTAFQHYNSIRISMPLRTSQSKKRRNRHPQTTESIPSSSSLDVDKEALLSNSVFRPSIEPRRTCGNVKYLVEVIHKKVRARTIESKFEYSNYMFDNSNYYGGNAAYIGPNPLTTNNSNNFLNKGFKGCKLSPYSIFQNNLMNKVKERVSKNTHNNSNSNISSNLKVNLMELKSIEDVDVGGESDGNSMIKVNNKNGKRNGNGNGNGNENKDMQVGYKNKNITIIDEIDTHKLPTQNIEQQPQENITAQPQLTYQKITSFRQNISQHPQPSHQQTKFKKYQQSAELIKYSQKQYRMDVGQEGRTQQYQYQHQYQYSNIHKLHRQSGKGNLGGQRGNGGNGKISGSYKNKKYSTQLEEQMKIQSFRSLQMYQLYNKQIKQADICNYDININHSQQQPQQPKNTIKHNIQKTRKIKQANPFRCRNRNVDMDVNMDMDININMNTNLDRNIGVDSNSNINSNVIRNKSNRSKKRGGSKSRSRSRIARTNAEKFISDASGCKDVVHGVSTIQQVQQSTANRQTHNIYINDHIPCKIKQIQVSKMSNKQILSLKPSIIKINKNINMAINKQAINSQALQ